MGWATISTCIVGLPPHAPPAASVRIPASGFATKETNGNVHLLANVSLGNQGYMACGSDWKAQESSLMWLSGPGQTSSNFKPQVSLQGPPSYFFPDADTDNLCKFPQVEMRVGGAESKACPLQNWDCVFIRRSPWKTRMHRTQGVGSSSSHRDDGERENPTGRSDPQQVLEIAP